MPRSIYSDNPDIWGCRMTVGANASSEGSPTRTAASAMEAYWFGIRTVSGTPDFRVIGYSDDGSADRVVFVGGHSSDTYCADEVRIYTSSTYDGTPKLSALFTTAALTLGSYNYAGGATNQFIKSADKIGTDIASDPLIFQCGAPTGNADGASIIFRNHRDGGSTGTSSRTGSIINSLELDKNGYAITRPGTADKRVMLGGTLKASANLNATNSGSGETDLASCTITAGLVQNNGDAIRLQFSASFAANANSKQVRVYFGTTLLWDSGSIAANSGRITVALTLYRTGATAQNWESISAGHPSLITDHAQGGTAAETWASAPVLKVTGQGVSSTDITLVNARWDYMPANVFNTAL